MTTPKTPVASPPQGRAEPSLGGTARAGIAWKNIPVTHTAWRTSFRLIPSRYPTVGLFDAIADAADLDIMFAIEALTNPRIRDEIDQLQLVPRADRVSGPGSTVVMAAFTHLNPEGSRFSDGSYGVYYAAQVLETAIAEVSHHRAVFLGRTREPAIDVDLRVINAAIDAPLHDLTGMGKRAAAWLAPDDYGTPQSLGRALRSAASWGVLFPSVRHAGGLCAGLFRPKALQHAKAGAHIALHWDGQRVTHWYEKRAPRAMA